MRAKAYNLTVRKSISGNWSGKLSSLPQRTIEKGKEISTTKATEGFTIQGMSRNELKLQCSLWLKSMVCASLSHYNLRRSVTGADQKSNPPAQMDN